MAPFGERGALGWRSEDVVVWPNDIGAELDDGGTSDAFGRLPDRGPYLAQ